MFDLPRYIKETHRENNQQMSERNQQMPTDPLIPSPTSSEVTNSYDSTIGFLQPNLPNNARLNSEHLSNILQSDDDDQQLINDQQSNTSENGTKINNGAALLTFVLYICSISVIIYGAIHFKDCPAEKMIAISYIVMGCLLLFSRILSSPEECRDIFNKDRNTTFDPKTFCRICFNFVIQIAVMCFFFAVCYWIFRMNPDTKEESPNYCNKEFYKNTYYGCIVALSLLGLGFLTTCCCICFFP